jgi:uracil-DNA glycosylase
MCSMPGRTKADISRVVVQSFESLAGAGITHIPKARGRAAKAAPSTQPGSSAVAAIGKAVAPTDEAASPSIAPENARLSRVDRLAALDLIRCDVSACQRCAELAATRRQTVFGVGNPEARLVFMGEAPGADEDRQGEPFVGRAGQLLTKIIEACTLKREDVYILNTLKCRPPDNRTPLPQEAANCREFLDRQLAILQPEFICCLGAVAAQNLLGTTVSIGRLRGRLHDFRAARVLCTYHPAYLLRNPAAKKDCWEDMQLLMREMGIAIEKNSAS